MSKRGVKADHGRDSEKNISDDEILEELGLDGDEKKESKYSHEQARVIAGFEDIVRFVDERGTRPEHGEGRDIFERLYAVRLERIRGDAVFRALVQDLDKHDLLAGAVNDTGIDPAELSEDELLSELGIESDDENPITNLKHVRPRAELQVAEEIATRIPCSDFPHFKSRFDGAQNELDRGLRESRRATNTKMEKIAQGEFFVVGGQLAYVAEVGEEEKRTKDERSDRRLRVIYDNGTESNLLMRSFQRALAKDEGARVIASASPGPLFASVAEESDVETGTIYVLRSQSPHPFIVENRDLVHKIGVTGGDVKIRTAAAEDDATFLFADVEVIATYKLFNINRTKLENVLHRFFASARINVAIPDRFGRSVTPREWFLLPLPVINEAVERVRNGTITTVRYDPKTGRIVG
jgi:hypothetical protein